jgi:hypothetical protein
MKMFVLLSFCALAAAEESESLSLLQTAAQVQSHSFGKEECKAAKADQKSNKDALKAARKAAKDAKAAAKAAKAAFIASKAATTEACVKEEKAPKAAATPVPELPTICRPTRGAGMRPGRPLTNNAGDLLVMDEMCAKGNWVKGKGTGMSQTLLKKNGKPLESPEACVDAALKDPVCLDGINKKDPPLPSVGGGQQPGAFFGAADFVNWDGATQACECGWRGDGNSGGHTEFSCKSNPGEEKYLCGFLGMGQAITTAGVVSTNPIR